MQHWTLSEAYFSLESHTIQKTNLEGLIMIKKNIEQTEDSKQTRKLSRLD